MDIKTVDLETEHWPRPKRFKARANMRESRIKTLDKQIFKLMNGPPDKHAKAKIATLNEEREQCVTWLKDAEIQIKNWFKN